MNTLVEVEQQLHKQRQKVKEAAEQREFRDKLAIAALAGMLTQGAFADKHYLARRAYELADAMLEQREVEE